MGIMNFFRSLILFFLCSFFSFSQENSKKINKEYTIEIIKHKVKRKQTLYTISKLYNVQIDDIIKYNNQIKGFNISRKMELSITIKKDIISKKEFSKIIIDSLQSDFKELKDFKLIY